MEFEEWMLELKRIAVEEYDFNKEEVFDREAWKNYFDDAGSASEDTSCRKCGASMPQLPRPSNDNGSPIYRAVFVTTGYACPCGHRNDLKRRKKKPNH